MPANRSSLFISDGTVFSSSKQYGPLNPGVVGKLYRVEARGVITFPLATLGSASNFYNSTVWGIQWGAHGYAPRDPIAGGDDGNWLAIAEHVPGEVNATWSPTTSNAYGLTGGPLSLEWAGQLHTNENIDIYFSMTSQEPAVTSVAITLSMTALWN